MGQYNIQFVANTAQSDAKIKQMSRYLQDLTAKVRQTGATFEFAEAEDLKFVQSLGTLSSRATNAKLRVTDMSRAIQELQIFYNRMTAAEKASPIGQASLASLTKMRSTLAAYKSELASVQATTASVVGAASKSASATTTSAGFMGGVFNGFGAMMKNMAAFTAVFGSFRLATNTIKEAVEAMKEFEYSNATLAAVLGKSKEEISELTDLARELGSTSLYSANEISQMQIVLARLGFKKEEINDATDAVAKLALATGDNLAKSATLTGSALRAFGYDAEYANHVAAVLGVSTTKSALDMEKLRTSMSYVGAVSHQVGFDIEDTVAMLGKLVDRGIQATTAGVGIRNILLDLSKSNSKLSKTIKHYTGKENIRSLDEFLEALQQLRAAGISMEDVANMIQKRVTPSFLELLVNTKGIKELRDELRGCDDDLNVMAEKMQNTLSGAVKMMHNAWNGLMLSFEETPGNLREVVLALTKVINGLKEMRASDEAKKKMQQYADTIITLTAVLAAYRIALNAAAIKTAFIAGIQKATKALKTMQAVMMANPYAAAATAVAILTMAYIKQKKAVQDLNNAKSDSRQVEEQAKKKYQEETVEVNYLSKVIHDNNKSLDERRTAIDRLQSIIPNYHAEISKEKGLYNENKEALDEYLKSLKSAIKLEAYKGKITELEQKAVDMDDQLMQKNKAGMMMASKKLSNPSEVSRLQNMYGLDTGSLLTNWQELSKYDPEINALSRQYELLWKDRDDLRKRIESLYNSMLSEKVNAESIVDNEGLEDGVQGTRGSGGGSKKSELEKAQEKVEQALTDYEIAIRRAALEKESGYINEEQYTKKILQAEERLFNVYGDVAATLDNPEFKQNFENEAQRIKELGEALAKLIKAREDAAEAEREATAKLRAQRAMDYKILRGLEGVANRAKTGWKPMGLDGIAERINLGIDIPDEEWERLVNEQINPVLKGLNLDKIRIEFETGNIEKVKSDLEVFKTQLSQMQSVVSGLGSIKSAITDMMSAFEEGTEPFEAFLGVMSSGFQMIESGIAIYEAFTKLQEISGILTKAHAAAKVADTAATNANTLASGANAISKKKEAAAAGKSASMHTVDAASKVAGSVAWVPIVGGILAAAAVAALIAQLVSAREESKNVGYMATGGIVEGNGSLARGTDTVPMMLTPGEVVLNAAQQSNVASRLQGAGGQMVMVQGESRITGEEIKIVYNNYAKRRGLKTQLA